MNKEEIDIVLDNDTLFQLMLEAHKRDITLNQLIEKILLNVLLDEIEKQNENKFSTFSDR